MVSETYEIPFYSTKNLKFLNITVVIKLKMMPITMDPRITYRNLNIKNPISAPSISKFMSLSATISLIESKRVMAIVSLYRHYPKIIENNLGYLYLSTTF